jgi:pimeloyl-ACP methyl ester carboxylesterase
MKIEPFTIAVPDADLHQLIDRLGATRWPDAVMDAGWDYGTNLEYLQQLCRYWKSEFDWRRQEQRLNELPQQRASIDGLGVHFVHQRSRSGSRRTIPLLLTHGYPDSFLRFERIIPMLTDPERFGADPDEAFDVVVPSLPGHGFSDRPLEKGMNPSEIARRFAALMAGLGYERYAAHGGDWGNAVTEELANVAPEALIGTHHTEVSYQHIFTVDPRDLSESEAQYVEAGKHWQMTEGAYAMLQGTKPQTLAYAMTDSPAGLAAWIVEKMRAWSDCDGEVERRFSKDQLLTNISLYWFTRTAGSAFRLYFETMRSNPATRAPPERRVPRAFAIFPKDIVPAPRAFAERFYDVRRWTEMPRGGHFAALEEPALLADDLRAFFFRDLAEASQLPPAG